MMGCSDSHLGLRCASALAAKSTDRAVPATACTATIAQNVGLHCGKGRNHRPNVRDPQHPKRATIDVQTHGHVLKLRLALADRALTVERAR